MKKVILNTPITDDVFKVSLYLKIADGILETLGGLLLFFVKPSQLNSLARLLTQHELSTDPKDFIAHNILKTAHELTSASIIFAAFYLLSHGVLKIVIVYEVLKKKLWAYSALIIVTAGFVIYQLYRLAIKLSFGLVLLTLFDLLIIYLTVKELKKQKILIKIESNITKD